MGLWSIYAIDRLTDTTLALVPPTIDTDGTPFDIGYPSVAQMDDVHLVFDVNDSAAGKDWIFAANTVTGETAVVATSSDFTVPGYTGDDTAIVYSRQDSGVPTHISVNRQPVASDKITPIGVTQSWLRNADFAVIYRRGAFAGPSEVDLTVSQSAVIQPGHLGVFTVEIMNQGPAPASNERSDADAPAARQNFAEKEPIAD